MKPQNVDLVLVVDASESMKPCFSQLKQHLNDLLYPLQQANFKVRFGLVAYAAAPTASGPVYDHTFIGGSGPEMIKKIYSPSPSAADFFTHDPTVVARVLAGLEAQGNEDTLLALDIAADLPFGSAETTQRVIAVFTDEPLENGVSGETPVAKIPELRQKLTQRKIMLFVSAPSSPAFYMLGKLGKAQFEEVDGGDGLKNVDFKKLLAQMAKSISVSSLQEGKEPAWQKALFGQDKEISHGANLSLKEVRSLMSATRDKWGNLEGADFDLARDGQFAGQKIAVLHLYTGEGFDFALPEAALKEKGFIIERWADEPPTPLELEVSLKNASQLWIISSNTAKLSSAHLNVISSFYTSGKGLYIWGDNDPYYADANLLSSKIFASSLSGNSTGDQIVHKFSEQSNIGMVSHPVCAGIDNLYEGVTISQISINQNLRPLVFGSDGNVVIAYGTSGKARALLDGGFTRLFIKWDSAGTARYVKNAAAWLAGA